MRVLTLLKGLFSSTKVTLPPGIKEIGPEGGVVELPGVAKLDIPPGSFAKREFISIKQVLISESVSSIRCVPDSDFCVAPEIFVAPIIKIQPETTELLKPAILSMPTDLSRVGSDHPIFVDYVFSETAQALDWTKDYELAFFDIKPLNTDYSEWISAHNRPIGITRFGFFSKTFPLHRAPSPAQYNNSEFTTSSANNFSSNTKTSAFKIAQTVSPQDDVERYQVVETNGAKASPLITKWLQDIFQDALVKDGGMKTDKSTKPFIPLIFSNEVIDYVNGQPIPALAGVTRDLKTGHINNIQFNACKIIGTQPCFYDGEMAAETFAHEIAHTFQHFPRHPKYGYGNSWFLESTAEYIGAYFASKYANVWGYSEYHPTDKGGLKASIRYQHKIQASQREIHSPLLWRDYSQMVFNPDIAPGNAYTANAFITNLALKSPRKELLVADLINSFASEKTSNSVNMDKDLYKSDAVFAVENALDTDFFNLYKTYAFDAYRKRNISLFPFELDELDFSNSATVGLPITFSKYFASQGDPQCTESGILLDSSTCVTDIIVGHSSVQVAGLHPDYALDINDFPQNSDVIIKFRKDLFEKSNESLFQTYDYINPADKFAIYHVEVRTNKVNRDGQEFEELEFIGEPKQLPETGLTIKNFNRDNDQTKHVFFIFNSNYFVHKKGDVCSTGSGNTCPTVSRALGIHIPLQVYLKDSQSSLNSVSPASFSTTSRPPLTVTGAGLAGISHILVQPIPDDPQAPLPAPTRLPVTSVSESGTSLTFLPVTLPGSFSYRFAGILQDDSSGQPCYISGQPSPQPSSSVSSQPSSAPSSSPSPRPSGSSSSQPSANPSGSTSPSSQPSTSPSDNCVLTNILEYQVTGTTQPQLIQAVRSWSIGFPVLYNTAMLVYPDGDETKKPAILVYITENIKDPAQVTIFNQAFEAKFGEYNNGTNIDIRFSNPANRFDPPWEQASGSLFNRILLPDSPEPNYAVIRMVPWSFLNEGPYLSQIHTEARADIDYSEGGKDRSRTVAGRVDLNEFEVSQEARRIVLDMAPYFGPGSDISYDAIEKYHVDPHSVFGP